MKIYGWHDESLEPGASCISLKTDATCISFNQILHSYLRPFSWCFLLTSIFIKPLLAYFTFIPVAPNTPTAHKSEVKLTLFLSIVQCINWRARLSALVRPIHSRRNWERALGVPSFLSWKNNRKMPERAYSWQVRYQVNSILEYKSMSHL